MPSCALNKATEKLLFKLGLRTDADLILHQPLRYEDETRLTPIGHALSGESAQFEAVVVSCEVSSSSRRQLLCWVRDGTGALLLRFLKFYPSQQKAFIPGARLRFFGEPREGFFGKEIVHPRCRVVIEGAPLPTYLTPVYPTTAGLSQTMLRRAILQALNRADLTESLPDGLRQKFNLATFEASVRSLHFSAKNSNLSLRRLAFDELLAQQLSLRRAHEDRHRQQAPSLPGTRNLTDRLLSGLPFQLTTAQRRVWREIATDLAQTTPMQRLLQGDVGSGKTIVAALALLQTVESGYQAALMVPTEILAEQHYRKLSAWFAPLGLEVIWLSGSVGKKARKVALEAIATGRVMLIVGTHALIEDGVTFFRLGLSIVDEQHRFGVAQRLALKQHAMHQLTMSATPIPRTLAMTYYADLTVSVIDELPPGRTPVLTKLVAENRREKVIERVRRACHAGQQVYWVCPLIEESEVLQLKTAQETFERLTMALPEMAIGLVHGRLKAAEKATVMSAFVQGEVQLLVATTVIEVGVDVANASLMVIEHAERFGLAQLHQLRGRVGRGTEGSACILLYASPLGVLARQRLKIIYENTDGFEVARLDLQLRGPGEFIGARQSGQPLLRFSDLEEVLLIEQARMAADEMLEKYPEQVKAHLNRWLAGREEWLKV